MSSVLKALQRLEKQRTSEEISVRSDLNTVDAPTVIRRQARRNFRSKRRRLIGIIVLVIGVGTLLALVKTVFWNPHPDAAGTSPRKTVATISELATDIEAKKPALVSDTRPQKLTASTSRTDSSTRPFKKKIVTGEERSVALKPATLSRKMPKSDQAVPLVRKPAKPFPQKAKAIPQRKDTHKSEITLKPAKKVTPYPKSPKTTSAKKPVSQSQVKPNNFRATPSQPTPSEVPKELGLTLQAITWLNNPQKRFTVINGSIIRLGEIVDGFRLTRIEEEQVTVEKDNQKWLLRFNRMDYSNTTP